MVSKTQAKLKKEIKSSSKQTAAKPGQEVSRTTQSPTCLTDSGVGGSDGDEEPEIRKITGYDFDEFVLSTVQECQKPLDAAVDPTSGVPDHNDESLWSKPEVDSSDSSDEATQEGSLVVKRMQKKHFKNQTYPVAKKTKATSNHTRVKRAKKSKPGFGSYTRSKESGLGEKSMDSRGGQTARNNDPDLTWMPIKYYANNPQAEARHYTEIGVQTEEETDAKKASTLSAGINPEEAYHRGPYWGTMALIQSLSMERFSWNSWIKFIEQSSGLGGSDSFGLYKWSTRTRPLAPESRREYSRKTAKHRFHGRQLLIQGTRFPDIDLDHFPVPDYILPARPRDCDRWGGPGSDKGRTPGEVSILLGKARNRQKIKGSMSLDAGLSSAECQESYRNSVAPIQNSRKKMSEIEGRKLPHPGATDVKVDKNKKCHLSVHLPVLGDPNDSVPSTPLIRSPVPDVCKFDEVNNRSQSRPAFIYGSNKQIQLTSKPLSVRGNLARSDDSQWNRHDKLTTDSLDLSMKVVKLPQINPTTSMVVRGETSDSTGNNAESGTPLWMEQLNQYRRQAMARSPEVPPGTPVTLPPQSPRPKEALTSNNSLLLPRKSLSGPSRPSTPMATSPGPSTSSSRRSSVTSTNSLKLPNIDEDNKTLAPRLSTQREPVKMPSLSPLRCTTRSPSDDCINEDGESEH